MNFWRPNINSTGRILRAVTGFIAGGSGVTLWIAGWPVAGIALSGFGAFCFYEAARGWCVARACGLKTRY